MILVITGDRHLNVSISLIGCILQHHDIDIHEDIEEVFGGEMPGIDRDGRIFAGNCDTPYQTWEAEWEEYGKRAGPLRNKEMCESADAALIIWPGDKQTSPSGYSALMAAKKAGIEVYECILRPVHKE